MVGPWLQIHEEKCAIEHRDRHHVGSTGGEGFLPSFRGTDSQNCKDDVEVGYKNNSHRENKFVPEKKNTTVSGR